MTAVEQIEILKKLRQNAAAYLLGTAARRLRDKDAPRNRDGTYDAQTLHRWSLDSAVDSGESDPLMRGGGKTSEALEAYRREKAREARRKNEEAEGVLINASDEYARLIEIARLQREQFESLGRRFGPEVEKAIYDAVTQAETEYRKLFAPQIVSGTYAGESSGNKKVSPAPLRPAKKKPEKKKQRGRALPGKGRK